MFSMSIESEFFFTYAALKDLTLSLIRTIYHSLTKTLSNRAMSSDKPKVLLLAPTGVAAINIDGTTIHTGLGIPVGYFGKKLAQAN